jgi:hypothetical protein
VDTSTQLIGEVLHGCTQTRVRLPASPDPPARNHLLWPGEHPSLVLFYILIPCVDFIVLRPQNPVRNTLFCDFFRLTLSFVCMVLLNPPRLVRVMISCPYLTVSNFLAILHQADYSIPCLFPIICAFINMHFSISFSFAVVIDFDRFRFF